MYDTTIATKLLGQLKAFLGRISPHFSKAVARGLLRSGALFKHMFPIGGDIWFLRRDASASKTSPMPPFPSRRILR